MNDAKPTDAQPPDDRPPGLGSQSEAELAALALAQAALDGLEDLATGHIVDDAELDKALATTAACQKSS